MPSIWIALSIGEESIALMMQMYNKDAVNQKDETTGMTSLHWAVMLKQNEVVSTLCRKEEFSEHILPNVEDKKNKTALQYAVDGDDEYIKKELMQTKAVRAWLDGLYQDRQVYVDAANAILVGAALIAGVTFAGWLQPPLGNINETYHTHIGVRIFCSFNSLSFFFSMATVLVGAGTVIPTSEDYIPDVVSIIRRNLFYTAFLFAVSIFFVLGAFAAAGFTVLPSGPNNHTNMIVTTLIGGITCLLSCGWFFFRLSIMRHDFNISWFTTRKSNLNLENYIPAMSYIDNTV